MEVPFDTVYNIFLRLPAKSLLRFRSISKSWCNTMDSLPFANKHMSTRVTAAAEEPELLPLSHNDKKQHSFVYEDGKAIEESERLLLEFSEDKYIDDIAIVCAYGLLCFQFLRLQSEIFIYNPARGEVLEVQPPARTGYTVFGIGFDSITDCYKIIQIVCRFPMRNKYAGPEWFLEKKVETQVCTLGTYSWRSVISSSFCLPFPCRHPGVSANGDIHWLNGNRINEEAYITSFNFRKEEFMKTPLPDFGYKIHYDPPLLINWKGFLGVVSFPFDPRIDIWIMKDYEEKEWVREYRIRSFVDSCCLNFWDMKKFSVGVIGAGLSFEAPCCARLFVVSPETNRVWNLKCPESYEFGKKLFVYTGSVLSLSNFGKPIGYPGPGKYKFLKKVNKVYLSPRSSAEDIGKQQAYHIRQFMEI